MNKSEEQSESINYMIRLCTDFNIKRNILLPFYLKSHIQDCSVQPLWAVLGEQFATMNNSSQGLEIISKATYKLVKLYADVYTQIVN